LFIEAIKVPGFIPENLISNQTETVLHFNCTLIGL
jgi:hypothetical protein